MKMRILAAASIAICVVPTLALSMEVAHVNGVTLTDKDMASALSGMNEGQRRNLLKDLNTKRQIVNSLIDQELLEQEAKKEKLDQDADFKAALEGFKKNYLANRVLSKNLSSKISDAAAKQFYENNKLRYSTDQLHAMHILVSDEAQAKEILSQAKAANADFQALAEKYSKDPSAKNNRGDIGYFGRAQLDPQFTQAAFSAKDGEIIGPVHTAYGYHIIKVIERKAGSVLEYSDVESRVKADLQEQATHSYLENLRKTAKVSVDDKALEKI
jgi:peptidyl-prolyl cis-trans isomerase C